MSRSVLRFGAMSRSLRLPAPVADLPSVVLLRDETPPFDWTRVFGRHSPVEIEIGAGKGLFLVSAGTQSPDRSFLGIERAGKYFRHAVARVHRSGLANVRLLRHDAFDVLDRWTARRLRRQLNRVASRGTAGWSVRSGQWPQPRFHRSQRK